MTDHLPAKSGGAAQRALTSYAWLSIAAAVVTIGLKAGAYYLTGSVGLLSDALESIVNLVGGFMALIMLTIAALPPDDEHTYGHSKAEYFSSGAEGGLIIVAAIGIVITAINRLLHPQELEKLGLGLLVCLGASLINLAVALVLLRAGKKNHSITLEANARHLMTDVWTSVGVIVGIGAVVLTGWKWLDSLVALAVGANICFTGGKIVRRSVLGLMDTSLPPEDIQLVRDIFKKYEAAGVQFHALRSRQSGAHRFVSMHVLVPGQWTVQAGHELLEKIEADIRSALPRITVFTHLESLDDPASWDDTTLDRGNPPSK
jgi:cation diffusion facilitator family transporter